MQTSLYIAELVLYICFGLLIMLGIMANFFDVSLYLNIYNAWYTDGFWISILFGVILFIIRILRHTIYIRN